MMADSKAGLEMMNEPNQDYTSSDADLLQTSNFSTRRFCSLDLPKDAVPLLSPLLPILPLLGTGAHQVL